MSERWRRELKKLRSVSPPEGLPDELGHRERIATPEPGRGRLLAGVLAFLVFGGTALLVWAVTRPETRGGAPAPSIAEPTPPPSASIAPADSVGVTCAKDGAHVDTPVVRLQHDGVHLDITGGSDADLLYVIEPDDPGQSWSLPAFRAAVGRLPLPPGRFAVGCFTQPFSRASTDPADYVPFTVVDPEGFWPLTGTEDACAQPLEGGVPGGGEVTTLDGQILVEAHAADGVDSDILVMNADGTGLGPLIATRDDEGEAVWSPDGSRIAFTRGGDIWVANSDGSGQVRSTVRMRASPHGRRTGPGSPSTGTGTRTHARTSRYT